jgi:hypothetical protein
MSLQEIFDVVYKLGGLGLLAILIWFLPRIMHELRKEREGIIDRFAFITAEHVKNLNSRSDLCREERDQFLKAITKMTGILGGMERMLLLIVRRTEADSSKNGEIEKEENSGRF